MIKNYFIIFSLLLLNNCSTPGTALIGPIFTGAKTGSIYQASLSYGSNKIADNLGFKNSLNYSNLKNKIKNNPILPDIPYIENDPIILLAYKVNYIEISEVLEPEPLP